MAFQSGQDFISFDSFSPPPISSNAEAGPSRQRDLPTPAKADAALPRKPTAQEPELTDVDRDILAKKNGLNGNTETPVVVGKRKKMGVDERARAVRDRRLARRKAKKAAAAALLNEGDAPKKAKKAPKAAPEPPAKKAKVSLPDGVGPKNLKEQRKAAERQAPWASLVEWDRCRDPAEM